MDRLAIGIGYGVMALAGFSALVALAVLCMDYWYRSMADASEFIAWAHERARRKREARHGEEGE